MFINGVQAIHGVPKGKKLLMSFEMKNEVGFSLVSCKISLMVKKWSRLQKLKLTEWANAAASLRR